MAFQAIAAVVRPTCQQACNASVVVTINPAAFGQAPYLIELIRIDVPSTVSATVSSLITTFFNVCPGTYRIDLTDNLGAKISIDVIILPSNTMPIVVELEIHDPTARNREDGWIRARVSGGRGIYTYEWSNGKTVNVIDELGVGNYYLIVKDPGGCLTTAFARLNARVNEPPTSEYQVALHNAKCCSAEVAAEAALAYITGSSKYQCLKKKSELLTNLVWVLCQQEV